MRTRIVSSAALACILLLGTGPVWAAVTPFSDDFESYSGNNTPLDKNYTGPPDNSAPNGSGNPWFGPYVPNLRVVGVENGVSPHSGNQMVRGVTASGSRDYDQDFLNLSYRCGGGAPLTGGFAVSWWFYDPLGNAANAQYCGDYLALDAYANVSTTADYIPGTVSGITVPSYSANRISLGMANNLSAGFDSSKYQSRVVGSTAGYANGWVNLNLTRSVGWHQAMIDVGPALADGSNLISFYIDDMNNPLDQRNSVSKVGYNLVELNALSSGTTTAGTYYSAYYDDIMVVVPEPATGLLLVLGLLPLLGRRRH